MADRFDERLVVADLGEGVSPITARGDCPAGVFAIVVSHVQQQPAVGQFDRFTLVGFWRGRAAQLPRSAVIVAANNVRTPEVALFGNVVAGHNQPAAAELDTAAGTRGVPGPAGFLGGCGDFDRIGPGESVVGTLGDPDGPRGLALAGYDLLLVIGTQVVGQQQPDGTGGLIDHRARVPAGVLGVVPNGLLGGKCLSAVGAPFDEQVDIAGVAAPRLAALGESQHGALAGDDHRGNAIGMVAVGLGGIDGGLPGH